MELEVSSLIPVLYRTCICPIPPFLSLALFFICQRFIAADMFEYGVLFCLLFGGSCAFYGGRGVGCI
jgi:hypothetical protein